jgi:cephalosporin hydroxylase
MGILRNLARKYKTDKYDKNHTFPVTGKSYIDVYENYFRKTRRDIKNVLELGVLHGSSLRMWRDFFPNAQIFGLDIDPRRVHKEKRIEVFTGSQDDPKALRKLINAAKHFDIIIDDASHVNRMTLASFNGLFGHVTPGGWYVIEDLRCSYTRGPGKCPGMAYNVNKNFKNKRKDLNDFFLEIIKNMDHFKGNIETVQFWSMMVFIKKAKPVGPKGYDSFSEFKMLS